MYDLISPPLPPGRRTLVSTVTLLDRDLHDRGADCDALHLAFEDDGAAVLLADGDLAAGGFGFVLVLGVIVADHAREALLAKLGHIAFD